MNSDLLTLQNPWWQPPGTTERDPHLMTIRGQPYYFPHAVRDTLTFQPGDFHILRGPRQVGKTTLLKEWIERLLRHGTPPQQILYLSCESLEHFSELQELLSQWLQSQREPTFLFLDEISFVPEWQRAVLGLINAGLCVRSVLCVTGSNARDLKQSSERFPGRRGQGKDLSLHPLQVGDYQQLACFAHHSPTQLLEIYYRVGGFPHAIRDYYRYALVSDETYRTYRNWIVGDAARFVLNEEYLKHLMFRIGETTGGQITWPTLIEHTPIQRHETAVTYLEHLQDAFLATIHYCYDPDKQGPVPRKARKVYWMDPLLLHLSLAWRRNIANIDAWVVAALADPSYRAQVLEGSLIQAARRKFATTYFWYSAKLKKEADLVVDHGDGIDLYDVKLSSTASYHVLGKSVTIIGPQTLLEWTT